MDKLCQWPRCTREAVWNVHTANDSKGFLTCVWHYGKVMAEFRKTGNQPVVDLATSLSAPNEDEEISRWEGEGGS